jgi:hypothetical protein
MSFKFNFNNCDESENKEDDSSEPNLPETVKESSEIKISTDQYDEIAKSLPEKSFEIFSSNQIEIGIIDSLLVSDNSNSDLVSGVYEGGFKIWECTQDLADYFTSNENESNFEGKVVCDLGCSAGVLGLLALKLKADKVHFQDYVSDLINCLGMIGIINDRYFILE